eukprot:Lankesteria_metandrocarpae@DN3161_c0_g1_i1.p1
MQWMASPTVPQGSQQHQHTSSSSRPSNTINDVGSTNTGTTLVDAPTPISQTSSTPQVNNGNATATVAPNANSTTATPNNITAAALKETQKVLLDALSALRRKDRSQFFWLPVDGMLVQDYYSIVMQPMDFSSMELKIKSGSYTEFELFEKDITLIVTNCKTYNSPATVYVKNALQLEVWWSRNRKKYANSFHNILITTTGGPLDQATGKAPTHSSLLPPVQRPGSHVEYRSAAASRASSLSTDGVASNTGSTNSTLVEAVNASSSTVTGMEATSTDTSNSGYGVSVAGTTTGGMCENNSVLQASNSTTGNSIIGKAGFINTNHQQQLQHQQQQQLQHQQQQQLQHQ